jgi:hypothetical protein
MKCNYGTVELKNGGGPKRHKEIVLEVSNSSTLFYNSWAHLTKSQASRLGNRLIKWGKKK